jgi:hypothetical protein
VRQINKNVDGTGFSRTHSRIGEPRANNNALAVVESRLQMGHCDKSHEWNSFQATSERGEKKEPGKEGRWMSMAKGRRFHNKEPNDRERPRTSLHCITATNASAPRWIEAQKLLTCTFSFETNETVLSEHRSFLFLGIMEKGRKKRENT